MKPTTSFDKAACVWLLFTCFSPILKAQLFIPIDHKGQVVNNALAFFEEAGQTATTNGDHADDVLYSSYGSNAHLFLRRHNILSFVTRRPLPTEVYDRWDVQLVGELANANAIATPAEVVDWYHNYYLATCPNGATHVAGFRRIVYRDVYPYTDMHVYSNAWGYKFYFVVRPGGDPNNILLSFDGPDSLNVDVDGSLKGWLGVNQFRFPHAIAYQQSNGGTVLLPWAVNYHEALNDHLVNFTFGQFDHTRPLIIDISESFGPLGVPRDSPIPEWGTYYGGSNEETAKRMCEVRDNGVAGCGETPSFDFPTTVGTMFIGTPGHTDGYLTHFDGDYHRVFNTFFGGELDDGFEAVVHGFGSQTHDHFVVAGYSRTPGIQMGGPPGSFVDETGPENYVGYNIVIVDCFADGTIMWKTYFGPEQGIGDPPGDYPAVANIGLTHTGDLVLAGNITQSGYYGWSGPVEIGEHTDQPTDGSFPICGTGYSQDFMGFFYFDHEGPIPPYHDGWVAKFNTSRQLYYSTLFGGTSATEVLSDMAVAPATDNVYLIGSTWSPASTGCVCPPSTSAGFPWCSFPGGYNQTALPGTGTWQEGNEIGYIACLNASNALTWCTAFGTHGITQHTRGVGISIAKSGQLELVDIVGNTDVGVYGTAQCMPPTSGFPQCNSSGYPFTFPLVGNPFGLRGFVARFDGITKQLLWCSSIGAAEATDVDTEGDKCYVSATRLSQMPNAQPLMDAPGFYSDLDPASVGDGLILAFDGDQFYGTCYGGDEEEKITNLVADQVGRIYVCGTTYSGSLFPLNNPIPGISWYVDELAQQSTDLFYGQVKLVLSPTAVSEIDPPSMDQPGLLTFPNPATSELNLLCGSAACAGAKFLAVYDALGQVVLEKNARPGASILDIQGLAPGTYQVAIRNAAGEILGRSVFVKR